MPKADNDTIAVILKAAFDLAARDGWHSMTPHAVAAETGLPLAVIYRYVETAPALLGLLARYADSQVLVEPMIVETRIRDNLFDLLMRRFDALTPFQDGLAQIWQQCPQLPLTFMVGGPQLAVSMSLILDAAGDCHHSIRRKICIAGLCALWCRVFMVWIKDTSPDLARTMATLDRDLNTAEMLALSMEDGPLTLARDIAGSIWRKRQNENTIN